MSAAPRLLKQWKSFGGLAKQYSHPSRSTKTDMRFTIYLPAVSETRSVPTLYYLSGLTCTDDNFTQKGFAHRAANELGIAIVAPDTSPRGCNIEGEDTSYDFGSGAGFYLDATMPLWRENYNMYSYIVEELPALVEQHFPVLSGVRSITGHSMGGHGALTIYLKNKAAYRSCSAFAPICNPVECGWGQKAFSGYLGPKEEQLEAWKSYDATELVRAAGQEQQQQQRILIDQGSDDDFLQQKQLLPENFQAACESAGIPLELRMQPGYDHSYFFISTFMEDHIRFHAEALNKEQ